MKLIKARIQNYRSILDTGEFEIEKLKTILVGPNEAGKTVILKALQQLKPPTDVKGFDALRDYPRSQYNDITTKVVLPKNVVVVTGWFGLDDSDKKLVPPEFYECQYELSTYLDNSQTHSLVNAPDKVRYKDLKLDLARLIAHIDRSGPTSEELGKPSKALVELTSQWKDEYALTSKDGDVLKKFLDDKITLIEEGNKSEEDRYARLSSKVVSNKQHSEVLDILDKQTPVFVLFNNYFKVKPSIHLGHLASRIELSVLDDDAYDYGNICLLKLLGFTAKELSDFGNTVSPAIDRPNAEVQAYKDKLDERTYKLNAASVKLTSEIRRVWMPNPNRPEADRLRVSADGQYLKVVVEDDLGVEIELDQRSEGFQWLVSFFVVFFAEAIDKHKNAILLLDEPGTSLHGLKQRDFRETISRLAQTNQTIFTTHSPFLVGPDELDIVRVVEMRDRSVGTKVTLSLSSSDPAGLLPLQEALGYDLAQSLFAQQRNLVLEGLTDYWYLEATSKLLIDGGVEGLHEKIALVFANSAGKLVYYATILHAHSLKVAALLDSDAAGDQAATQENLVHTLGNKNILRTKDYVDDVAKAEIEDLLRDTLIDIAKVAFGTDCTQTALAHPTRPIIDIFTKEISEFSKYKLAKAYVRWTRDNSLNDLKTNEIEQWKKLVQAINKALK